MNISRNFVDSSNPQGGRYNMGCTSGTILLDQGSFNLPLEEVEEGKLGVKDMKEVKITFHRSCFWIYGRKMAKADLSYVVQPNQKVHFKLINNVAL